jgi:hypothetical protein
MAELSKIDPMNLDNLYRIVTLTDLKFSEVMVLVPVILSPEGVMLDFVTPERPMRFFSSLNVVMGAQQFPVRFEIIAASLREALEQANIQGPIAGQKFEQEIEDQRTRARILGAAQMESLAAPKQ